MSRKFSFSSLVGNANTIMLLKRSLMLNTFKKFTIFGGTLGTGKSTCAGIAAMTLTCENPNNGEPCMQCEACKANQKALAEGGVSPFVKIVNMGKMGKFEDVTDLIKDVFVLQGGASRQVYIFEEVHAIKAIRGGFTSFLAEIDRMPENVYVIMCTTALSDIPNDLKSRAIIFNFNRLDKKDSLVLAKHLAESHNLRVTDRYLKMIVSDAKGVPRNIEKLIEFAKDNCITEEELRDYLQKISLDWFIQWFTSMKFASINDTIEMLKDILQRVDATQFRYALRDFCLSTAFLIEGNVVGDFTGSEANEVRGLFSSKQVTKIVSVVESLGKESADLDLALLKFYAIMQDRAIQSIVTNKNSVAARERVLAEREAANSVAMTPAHSSTLKPLSLKSIGQLVKNES